jgi:hypothetical protein
MMVRNQTVKRDKLVFLFSLLLLGYFSALILVSQLEYRPVLLGVVQEVVTLPAIGGLLVLLVLSVRTLVKEGFKWNSFSVYSLLLLLLTVAILVGFA